MSAAVLTTDGSRSTVYSIAWIMYLTLAQTDPPTNVSLPFLPLLPYRCAKVTLHVLRLTRDAVSMQAIHLFLDLQFRRVMVLAGKDAKATVKQNVLYAEGNRRLDIYFAIKDADELSPVIVYVGGGNWRWWNKLGGAQAALRLRQLGYTVIVPALRQYPEAKSPEMVRRRATLVYMLC